MCLFMEPSEEERSRVGATGRHRLEVLATLVAICGELERLQSSIAGKEACREVQRRLEGWRRAERDGSEAGGMTAR